MFAYTYFSAAVLKMQQTKYLKQNRSWNLEFSSVQIKDVLLQWIFRWALFSACQLIADTIWFKSQPLWHMAIQIGKQSQCLLDCCVYCFRERAEIQGLTRQCLHHKKTWSWISKTRNSPAWFGINIHPTRGFHHLYLSLTHSMASEASPVVKLLYRHSNSFLGRFKD